jgi:rRNA maturation endonuclease Nob1
MGIFNRLGRQVETFKKRAETAAAETAEYQCTACKTRFHVDHESCPECGADAVERVADAE